MEKYKELYELSKEVLKEESNRFIRIDEKATKYLSTLTIVVGAAAYFVKWTVVDLLPPKSAIEWAIVILAIILCVAVFVSWVLIFKSMRLHNIKKPPINDQMIKFFDDNEMIDIYYQLTKRNKEALIENRETTDRKAKMLYYGYNAIIISGLVLMVFLCLFLYYSYLN